MSFKQIKQNKMKTLKIQEIVIASVFIFAIAFAVLSKVVFDL